MQTDVQSHSLRLSLAPFSLPTHGSGVHWYELATFSKAMIARVGNGLESTSFTSPGVNSRHRFMSAPWCKLCGGDFIHARFCDF